MIGFTAVGVPAFAHERRGYPEGELSATGRKLGVGTVSTVLIVVLAAAVAVVVAGVLFTGVGRRRGGGLKRRFGPEYDRVLVRHGGDTKAAERELGERVRIYGSFTPQPLPPQVREQYLSRWTAAQEGFVESPRQALAEVHQLLGGLAQARGFPGPERQGEHWDALSVHHPHHVGAYRQLHAAAMGGMPGPADGAGHVAPNRPASPVNGPVNGPGHAEAAPGATAGMHGPGAGAGAHGAGAGAPGAGAYAAGAGTPGAEGAAGTEDLRVLMLQAREFFDALATEHPEPQHGSAGRRTGRAAHSRHAARPLTHDGPARGLFGTRRPAKGREAS